jgi:hypothetical protein
VRLGRLALWKPDGRLLSVDRRPNIDLERCQHPQASQRRLQQVQRCMWRLINVHLCAPLPAPRTQKPHTVHAPAARRAAVAGALTVLPPTLVNATNMIAPRARPQTRSSSSGTANACSSPSRPTRGPPSTTSPTGSAPERTTGWAHPPARAGSGSPRASPPRHPLPRRRHRHRACPRSGRPRAC